MKKLLLLLIIVAAATNIYSQEDIRSNILSYADSTELMIRNGRQLIVDRTLAGNHHEALKTLNYLKENIDKRYVILYPVEELLLSLATRNFSLFLYNARNFDNLLEGKTRVVFNQSMGLELQEYLLNEMPFIIDDLDAFMMPDEDKDVIRLYIRYYMHEDKEELNKSIKRYQKTYPLTEYTYFLNEIKKHTTTGSMNFAFGYGNRRIHQQTLYVALHRWKHQQD